MKEFTILDNQELLDFLYANLENTKKDTKSFLVHGNVRVNDKVITKYNYLLHKNDTVKIVFSKSNELDIIYEDKDIVVINKPSGLLTVANDKKDKTLYSMVSDYVKKSNPKNKIFVIHRLDQDTSGIVMFAKSEIIKEKYQNSWDLLVIKRSYIALVSGITPDSGILKSYLTENENHKVYSTTNKKGKLAITKYKKIRSVNDKTLLEIEIETGRKNQIRTQLSELGNPIVGDKKYGGINNKRLCLHANELIITNPINNKKMKFTCILPSDIKCFK